MNMLSAADLKEIIKRTITERKTEFQNLSDEIWENAELSMQEYNAHDLLTSFLEKEGFKVAKKTPLETAFIARYGDSSGLKIGICCEYDALPDLGHACGHNLIAEVGIAASIGLKATLLESSKKFEIIVFGTPGEESVGGKLKMIEKGVFDEVDICMMSHPTPFEIPTPYWLSSMKVDVIFTGKPAHAGAAPWTGVNALDAVVSCYNSISMLRQQIKPDQRLHCIIMDGGTAVNVIPEKCSMSIGIRALKTAERLELLAKVRNCVRAVEFSTGCTSEIHESLVYESVKTNKTLIDLYKDNVKQFGVVPCDMDTTTAMASTDFGNVTQIKPSIHPLFKIKTVDNAFNHTRPFAQASKHNENQEATLISAMGIAMSAIDVVSDFRIMEKVKEDFDKE